MIGKLSAFLKPGSQMRRAYMVLIFVFATPFRDMLSVGAALVVAAELWVLLSYSVLRRNEALTTQGPYTLVRNPVYAGAVTACVGFFFLAGAGLASERHLSVYPFLIRLREGLYLNPVVLAVSVPFLVAFVTHYMRRIREEEAKLLKHFGDAYSAYLERVPTRLLPYLPNLRKRDWFMFEASVELAARNRVFSRVVKYGIWLVLFCGKGAHLWNADRSELLAFWTDKDFPLFFGLLVLMVILHVLARRLQSGVEPLRNAQTPPLVEMSVGEDPPSERVTP